MARTRVFRFLKDVHHNQFAPHVKDEKILFEPGDAGVTVSDLRNKLNVGLDEFELGTEVEEVYENNQPKVLDKRRFTEDGPVNADFSPSSQAKEVPGMDFPAAIREVIKGHRVTRLEWENPDIWLIMFYWGRINPKTGPGKYLSIHHADGTMSQLYVSDGDLLANDWVIVS